MTQRRLPFPRRRPRGRQAAATVPPRARARRADGRSAAATASTRRSAATTVTLTPVEVEAGPAVVDPAASPAEPTLVVANSAEPALVVANSAEPALVVATADRSLLRMLSFALDQMRLAHRTFTSGTAVLEALLASPAGERPSVVVLDVDLPGVDGHAILERLGAERPDTFLIVVLSSHADESVQVRSLLAGALDHLAKPFNVRVLMAKLQRWTAIARRCEGTP